MVIERAVTFRRRGVETRIVIPGREKILAPDAKLIALINKATGGSRNCEMAERNRSAISPVTMK